MVRKLKGDNSITKNGKRLVIKQGLALPGRAVIFVLGFFPLLAPYELLIRPHWKFEWHWFLLFPAVISLGACSVTVFMFAFALCGLDEVFAFDFGAKTVVYERQGPLIRYRRL